MTDQKYMRPGLDFATGKLVEELGELLAALGKTMRWGRDSFNPELPPAAQEPNWHWIEREIDDVLGAIANYRKEAGTATPARTDDAAQALDEKAIRHDERKKIIAGGCIHTRKAGEQDGDGDRADIRAWQEANSQWFDATICEIVSEYAAWRDAQAGGDVAAMREAAAALVERLAADKYQADLAADIRALPLPSQEVEPAAGDLATERSLQLVRSAIFASKLGGCSADVYEAAESIIAALSTQAAYPTGAGEGNEARNILRAITARMTTACDWTKPGKDHVKVRTADWHVLMEIGVQARAATQQKEPGL